jgi:hypothetical protein
MTFGEIIAVNCENHIKLTNTLCGREAGLMIIKAGGRPAGVNESTGTTKRRKMLTLIIMIIIRIHTQTD